MDNEIHNLYQVAKQITGNDEVVLPSRFIKKLRELRPENDLTGGLISAIEGVAKNRGILDPKTGIYRNITPGEAESLIKSINARYSKSNPNSNRVSRILKDAIDDDVLKTAGENVFKRGRQAKAQFEKDLRSSGASKFTRRGTSIVRIY